MKLGFGKYDSIVWVAIILSFIFYLMALYEGY